MTQAFYQFMLYATKFELAIAKAAPVRNASYIGQLKNDVMKWEHELQLWRLNHEQLS